MENIISINTDSQYISEKKIYDLLPEGSPELSIPSMKFDFEYTLVDPVELASNLVETCKKHGALGLSAIQVGIPSRVFVMGSDENYVAHFNPELLTVDDEIVYDYEGCLSFPNLFMKVKRPNKIVVRYQDYTGKEHIQTYTGLTSRVFQHEYDHLNGVTFDKKVGKATLDLAMRKRKKHK